MRNIKAKIEALIGWSVLSVGLAACSPSVDGWQILAAQKYCEQRGGIDNMRTVLGVSATCRDGTFFRPGG